VTVNVGIVFAQSGKVAQNLTECLPATYSLPHLEYQCRRMLMEDKRRGESKYS
jgi:hypothetical protein